MVVVVIYLNRGGFLFKSHPKDSHLPYSLTGPALTKTIKLGKKMCINFKLLKDPTSNLTEQLLKT